MPRSRRRHHSRSRSRSHSHDRDREPKRRRVESPDSHHRRSVSDDSEVTPKKTIMSPKQVQKKLDSQKKRQLEKEEREKKRQEEKLKRDEQKRKEKEEKEEQKRKEKEEKEEQKRKEKEEKEEQKRKEREEKEELKKKEREEKEEQKKKEREEKEEQKKKEREEKEEQKRKEREEKELKKQQELEEKNRDKKKKEEQIEKEKAAFVNFFVPRKSASAADFKKPEEAKTYAFMPFAVKSDMRLAPVIRKTLSDDQKQNLVDKLGEQLETVLYLNEIKNGKKLGCSSRTWPVEDDNSDDVVLVEDADIGECVEEQPKTEKMRAKLLKFHENRRPAYFGTWRKKSKRVNPRKPFALEELFDYEVDSDDDWEEEEPGESLHGSDDEDKENESDDYEVDNEFFVPHAYLSDDEKEAEENAAVSPETQKEKLKLLQIEFDEEMKSKTERIKPRLIGCIWENKLVPKVQDAVNKFLQDRMMIMTGTVTIQKRDLLNTSVKLSASKQVTPGRKLLSQELIPEFLQLIHGNTNNRGFLVNEFLNYLSKKGLDSNASKAGALFQLKQLAKWKKCPDEGVMLNKLCWYVDEDVRNQYNVNLTLPNKWTYTTNSEETTAARRKLIVS